jgi:hypothetical protein
MVSLISYLVVTIVVGFLLSFAIISLRSTKKRGDGTPYPTVAICLLLTVGGPFMYIETLTKIYGPEMSKAVHKAYDDAPVQGPMQYFRVRSKSGDRANVIAIGREKEGWGGYDQPIISIDLTKTSAGWKPETLTVIYSDRLDRDNLIIPPYR